MSARLARLVMPADLVPGMTVQFAEGPAVIGELAARELCCNVTFRLPSGARQVHGQDWSKPLRVLLPTEGETDETEGASPDVG